MRSALMSIWKSGFLCHGQVPNGTFKVEKDTGGGDVQFPYIFNFCGVETWLVWVICTDFSSRFLLAS